MVGRRIDIHANVEKIVLKTPVKIQSVYEKSPYYLGTKWNNLSKETQKKENVHVFKKDVDRLY